MRVQTTVTLSEREERFCFALAHGFRPTRAATLAGYAVGSARNLLAKPHVRAAIKAINRNTAAVVARIETAEKREAGSG
mgnify:CR=1 FL=1